MPFKPRGSSGNATVPSDAVILPYQAFVDGAPSLFANSDTLSLASKGITSIDNTVVINWYETRVYRSIGAGGSAACVINLSGNAITDGTALDDLLDGILESSLSTDHPGTVNISGGTMAAMPNTGVIITGGNGGPWTSGYHVIGTLNGKNQYQGDYTYNGVTFFIEWDGSQWQVNAPDGDGIIYTSAEAVALPTQVVSWTDVFSQGAIQVTTGNRNKASLHAKGWTVTTN